MPVYEDQLEKPHKKEEKHGQARQAHPRAAATATCWICMSSLSSSLDPIASMPCALEKAPAEKGQALCTLEKGIPCHCHRISRDMPLGHKWPSTKSRVLGSRTGWIHRQESLGFQVWLAKRGEESLVCLAERARKRDGAAEMGGLPSP